MFWTQKPPTENGVYWWRENIGRHAFAVQVMGAYGFTTTGQCKLLKDFGGHWYGPLQEPGGDAIENCSEAEQARIKEATDARE